MAPLWFDGLDPSKINVSLILLSPKAISSD
jgi:hypothetical protein